MKIKEIYGQHRRDFNAIYECEHCGETKDGSGYDDTFFHTKVIPKMICDKCGKIAGKQKTVVATTTRFSIPI